MALLVFYAFAVMALLSAVIVVTTRNVVHAAFALMVTLVSVSAFYVFLDADFLAVIQLLVYVGGILVLVLFGVMMTSGRLLVKLRAPVRQLAPAAVLGVVLLALLLHVSVGEAPWEQFVLVDNADGTATQAVAAVKADHPSLRSTTVTSRVMVEYRLDDDPDNLPEYPGSPADRLLEQAVATALIRTGISRMYVVQSRPDPLNPTRHVVLVEKRVTSITRDHGAANVTDSELALIEDAVLARPVRGYEDASLQRPGMLLVTGVDAKARIGLLSEHGLTEITDVRTVVGLGDAVMLGEFLLPFEIVGAVLLVALIGAAVVSRKELEA